MLINQNKLKMGNRIILTLTTILLFSGGVFAQKTPKIISNESVQKILSFENALNSENAIFEFNKLYDLDQDNTFQGLKMNLDPSGMSHQRYQQYYKGIIVEYGTLITHSRNGLVQSINGELYNAKNISILPNISSKAGLQYAITATGAQKYVWEDKLEAEANSYVKPTGELVIYSNINTGKINLAFKYDIFASLPVSREEVYVDAHTGKILFRNQIIKHLNNTIVSKKLKNEISNFENVIDVKTKVITANADTKYSGSRSIETSFNTSLNAYVLNDLTRGNGIITYNSESTDTMPSTHFTDSDNNWSAAEFDNATFDNVALDAHWGAEKTFDFWKNTFNRNSFDDNNGQIRSYVHYTPTSGSGWDNAQWTGSVMRYGDGVNLTPLTSVDVLGHEIGHAVCQYTAKLVYSYQSGAMNEGYSDIWGACIEQYSKFGNLNAGQDTTSPGTLGVWKIGEQLGSNLRSMSYPLSKGNPDTYLGTNWSTGTADSGGVHNNSGVLNHWFYILTAGKSGTNNATIIANRDTYAVTGIGMTKSSQIAYYAERDYLTPNATYFDARNATLLVAKNIYGCAANEYIQVMNSWNAVNVGTKYTTIDAMIKTVTVNSSVACGAPYSASFEVENLGSVAVPNTSTLNYSVDGGTAINIPWVGGDLTLCTSKSYNITLGVLSRGTHVVSVTVTTLDDGEVLNNTATGVITVNTIGVANSINTFNAVTDALVSIDESGTTNTIWERGTLATKTKLTNAVAGSQVYATKLTSAKYPVGVESYLVSQCYNIANLINPTVSFDMAFDLEANYDYITFEYSTNGGTFWNVLGTATDTNWYNSSRTFTSSGSVDCDDCPGKQWTGDYGTAPVGGNGVNGNKRNYSHTLSTFGSGGTTPASNMIFRLKFYSDGGVAQEGAFIDNFVVQGTLSTQENSFENFAVYPNPSNGFFNVVLSTTEKVNISVFDLRGRSIYNESFSNNNSVFNKELNLSKLSSGVYMLNVESEGKKATKKIIIE